MSKVEIIQAWKDAQYRVHLSAEELELLPEHPAGCIELDDDEMEQIQGAATLACLTAGCCTFLYGCTLGVFCLAVQIAF